MKQVIGVGFLLVVPFAAWILAISIEDDAPPKRQRLASAPSVDPEQLETREREQGGLAPPRLDESRSRVDAPDFSGMAESESAAEVPDDDFEEETDPVEESRRIRLPVTQAIRSSHPTAGSRREAMLDALRKSGTSDEEWTKRSTAVFDDWMRGISTDIGLRSNWSSAQCYQAGCEVELSFPDRASYERAAQEFRSLRDEDAAHGGRVQTPAIEGERGEILASWIMMRPDGSRP